MQTKLASLHLVLVLTISAVSAQTPTPVVVQAVPPVNATSPQNQPVQPGAASPGALKTLQDMKATNADILKKQEATLKQLDELQKAAEQLKIYSKRA